ncbi:unnamed protein product [Onchocerca ochengi]|uniref:EB domain-containing protein n=1 Tax=Onchocerca ochengi TaxID=42157 RepID=A0A182EMC2_ONCOC|nr:unnamed protein product [Onchocerca ochengi]
MGKRIIRKTLHAAAYCHSMRHYFLSATIYYLLIVFFTFHFQQLHALRCKCNANRGPSPCTGDFCDIHNRDGKRAACGALRRSRQTIFACVLIRQTSNDTYCHVIGSTTACWCRQMDFCNADLEAELFDVDESMDVSSDDSDEISESSPNLVSNLQREKFVVKANLQQISTNLQPVVTIIPEQSHDITTRTVKSTTLSDIKQSMKTKINPAIRIDVAEKIKLTPQRENPPTVMTEIISDSYEYELDDE